jgi:hypothetical protein
VPTEALVLLGTVRKLVETKRHNVNNCFSVDYFCPRPKNWSGEIRHERRRIVRDLLECIRLLLEN